MKCNVFYVQTVCRKLSVYSVHTEPLKDVQNILEEKGGIVSTYSLVQKDQKIGQTQLKESSKGKGEKSKDEKNKREERKGKKDRLKVKVKKINAQPTCNLYKRI